MSCDLQSAAVEDADHGTVDTDSSRPPDDFEWKTVCDTKLTFKTTTEMLVSAESKPYTDISDFHDVDSHAAEASVELHVLKLKVFVAREFYQVDGKAVIFMHSLTQIITSAMVTKYVEVLT